MFAKVDVNGRDAHPLFEWLRTQKSGVFGGRIKWNFTKFLVNRDGGRRRTLRTGHQTREIGRAHREAAVTRRR